MRKRAMTTGTDDKIQDSSDLSSDNEGVDSDDVDSDEMESLCFGIEDDKDNEILMQQDFVHL